MGKAKEATASLKYDLSDLHVLVVERTNYACSVMRSMLRGLDIVTVYDAVRATDALQKVCNYCPDLIVCDWNIEPFDGFDFVRMIRTSKDVPNPYVPVIMLGAFPLMSGVVAARDAGVTEFLAKPVSLRALYERIVAIIEQPRPFVLCRSYFGPDRRRPRKASLFFHGPNRRLDPEEAENDEDKKKAQDRALRHQLIEPPNLLRLKIESGSAGSIEALHRVNEAVAELRSGYASWMVSDIEEMHEAVICAETDTANRPRHLRAVLDIAPDVVDQARSLGYSLIAKIADSLTRLVKKGAALDADAMRGIKLHVDAMRAVAHERVLGEGGDLGRELVYGLSAVAAKTGL